MNSSKGYFYYFIWMLGALVLMYYGHQFTDMMNHKTQTLGKIDYGLIGKIAYGLAFGLYLSFLNGFPNRRKFHRPLFAFVFVPSFLLLIYPIITMYVKQIYIVDYFEIVRDPQMFFFGMLTALSLIKSTFTTR
ncbi:hypothetical protein P9H28_11845 [Paenibacillus barengoltzii]|uniref:hypothetical protein n=1 Tax=Paenibacillus barengoltzii TaxID=343517 RepID=UPI002DB9C251|nr:hypothetical protein [Paenibacillus barengoltzii]MEC2344774.1 hypothetical protein [Paenibacillus barengoltzii]